MFTLLQVFVGKTYFDVESAKNPSQITKSNCLSPKTTHKKYEFEGNNQHSQKNSEIFTPPTQLCKMRKYKVDLEGKNAKSWGKQRKHSTT